MTRAIPARRPLVSIPRTGGPPRPAEPTRRAVGVLLLADDALTRDGATAYLRTCRDVTLLPAEQAGVADVVLLLAREVGEETLDRVEAVVASVAGGAPAWPRLVLVTEVVHERQLGRAIALGLRSVLARPAATWESVVAAVVAARDGWGEMPGAALGWLIDQVRALQPGGEPACAAGLSEREVEVLSRLSEGRSTAEIAAAMSYSERTVKAVIHGVVSRLNLRNRLHAVAYALRAGAL